jgi:hypothetical protein
MSRPTNQELCGEFRKLLTVDAQLRLSPEIMADTKLWRGDLWKAFRELENRLCPTPELMRKENDNG